MQKADDNFYILLLIATSGIILLVILATLLVVLFRNKALKQEQALQQAALNHQKDLVSAAIDSQEKERLHIGRELHDNISNAVIVLQLNIQKGDQHMSMDLSHKILASVRSLSHQLSPSQIQLFGLGDAVYELCAQLQQTASITVHADIAENLNQLPYAIALHSYRILQEQITNTLKYANARNIHVKLELQKNNLFLFYSDDGTGFDYHHSAKNNGIHNMESRVQVMNAASRFFSAPGAGVQLEIHITLQGSQ